MVPSIGCGVGTVSRQVSTASDVQCLLASTGSQYRAAHSTRVGRWCKVPSTYWSRGGRSFSHSRSKLNLPGIPIEEAGARG